MKRTSLDYLEDILESMDLIEEFTNSISFEDFKNDKKTNYAVVRSIEIIGEAAKNVSDDIKKEFPNIPWQKMAGMRNKIAHEYFGISLKIVWNVAKEDLPQIKDDIKFLLKKYDE